MEIYKENEKEEKSRWTNLLLIINLIIWGIILFLSFIFNGIVKADTVEYNTNTIYLRDTGGTYHGYTNTSRQTVGFTTNLINYQWTTYESGVVDLTVVLRIYNYNRPNKPTLSINVTENGSSVQNSNSSYSCSLAWDSSELSGQLQCSIRVLTVLNGGSYFEVQVTPNYTLPYIDFQAYGTAAITPNATATSEDIQNQTIQIINNQNANNNILVNKFDELMGEWDNELSASYTSRDPNGNEFEDLEDIETELNNYTDVNLDSFDVDLDSDTNSWVWTTLTSLINTNTLIFGMIISILSIGLIKLILNR